MDWVPGGRLGARPGFDARRYGHLLIWVGTHQGKAAMAPTSRSAIRGVDELWSRVLCGTLTSMTKGLGVQAMARAEEATTTTPSQNKCTSKVLVNTSLLV